METNLVQVINSSGNQECAQPTLPQAPQDGVEEGKTTVVESFLCRHTWLSQMLSSPVGQVGRGGTSCQSRTVSWKRAGRREEGKSYRKEIDKRERDRKWVFTRLKNLQVTIYK